MRLPYPWLVEHLPTAPPMESLCPLLNMGIAEVDAIEQVDGEDVLLLGLKPDRGDCLSVEGLAREVAALANLHFDEPAAPTQPPADLPGALHCDVRIEDESLCGRYVGWVMDGVEVGPSPEWLQRRIRQVGLRPVNNVVDISNFVMFEMGQPLHAFDLDRLHGPSIVVRTARRGETLEAINGQTFSLTADQLVIADAEFPVAIAGVMGGLQTEVSTSTRRILIESAQFSAVSVRRTSRALALRSDASDRFSKGVDSSGCLRAAQRAAALIAELAGGRSQSVIDVHPVVLSDRAIVLRLDRVRKLLGMDLSDTVICDCMVRLGLQAELADGQIVAQIPPRRPDLEIEEDLVEEVARVVGYEHVPVRLPTGPTTPGRVIPERRTLDLIRDAMVGCGYTEIRSYSLVNPALIARVPGERPAVLVDNPMSLDRSALRPSLTVSLLETAEKGIAHGFRNQHLFEIGRVFARGENTIRPEEWEHAAGFAMGSAWSSAWNLEDPASDFFAVRGALDNLAAALRLKLMFRPQQDSPLLHPGRAATVALEGGLLTPEGRVDVELGWIGELHPLVIEEFGLLGRPVAFELDLNPLMAANLREADRQVDLEVFRQPPATRDLAMVLPRSAAVADVIRAIRETQPLIVDARPFDLYQGAGLAEGEKSLAISLVLRAPDRTLTDAEANAAIDEAVQVVSSRFGGRRR